jgi:hypothetical protein
MLIERDFQSFSLPQILGSSRQGIFLPLPLHATLKLDSRHQRYSLGKCS